MFTGRLGVAMSNGTTSYLTSVPRLMGKYYTVIASEELLVSCKMREFTLSCLAYDKGGLASYNWSREFFANHLQK